MPFAALLKVRTAFFAAVTLAASTAFAQVTVSSPANGANVSSPTTIVASATTTNGKPITGMKIYVDGASKYSTSSSKVSTSVSMSVGTRKLTVKAWDSAGTVYSKSLSVNVVSASAPSEIVLTPPSTAKVFTNIDQMGGWDACTECAGGGASAIYWMKQGQSSPSLDGKSTEFHVGGDVPFSHGLWWNRLDSTDSSVSNFVYEIAVYAKEPNKSFGMEFAANQAYGGKRWKFSTQCSYNKGIFSIWDALNARWSATTVPCIRPTAYTWNYYKFEYRRTSDGLSQWVAITVNGKRYYVNRTMKPEPLSTNGMNIHFQINGNTTQQDYSAWADKIKLTYW